MILRQDTFPLSEGLLTLSLRRGGKNTYVQPDGVQCRCGSLMRAASWEDAHECLTCGRKVMGREIILIAQEYLDYWRREMAMNPDYDERPMGRVTVPTGGPPKIGLLDHITAGLKQAVDNGWLTDAEAKAEVRAMLPLTAAADAKKDFRDQEIARLKKQVAELEAELD